MNHSFFQQARFANAGWCLSGLEPRVQNGEADVRFVRSTARSTCRSESTPEMFAQARKRFWKPKRNQRRSAPAQTCGAFPQNSTYLTREKGVPRFPHRLSCFQWRGLEVADSTSSCTKSPPQARDVFLTLMHVVSSLASPNGFVFVSLCTKQTKGTAPANKKTSLHDLR